MKDIGQSKRRIGDKNGQRKVSKKMIFSFHGRDSSVNPRIIRKMLFLLDKYRLMG